MGTLSAQFLLQFYADPFETLQVFLSWSENVYVFWILSSDYILSLFLHFEHSHFSGVNTIKRCIDNGYLVCTTPPTVLCRSF